MTYSAWIDDEDDVSFGSDQPAHVRTLLPIIGTIAVGLCATAAAVMVAAIVFSWSGQKATIADPALPDTRMIRAEDLAALAEDIPPVDLNDIGSFRSAGLVAATPNVIFAPGLDAKPSVFLRTATAEPSIADEPLPRAPTVEIVRVVPLPSANPLGARRGLPPDESLRATPPDVAQLSAAPPLPSRNPLLQAKPQVASLEPADRPLEKEPTPAGQALLPGPGDRFALYDIKGRVVYMPNGDKMEAHSGYGEMFDDPRHVAKKMVGPTPPNTYDLTMREARFHGVEALRMKPVGGNPMYGRDGFLTHPYMLGPRGDSNGCVSFRDYDKFLAAYKRGEVTRLVVVASLPTKPEPANPLLSWLTSAAAR
ncbi:tlde1 domain-containing protein [Azorhizobium sp. AG788]|uniref:DUF2778 domain-containing protein n=1 Tax=Azorhizobium sp. AG788 TaxID=2183897 RepID=UPI003139355C